MRRPCDVVAVDFESCQLAHIARVGKVWVGLFSVWASVHPLKADTASVHTAPQTAMPHTARLVMPVSNEGMRRHLFKAH